MVFFGFGRAKLNYLPLHAGSCETLRWLFFCCFWSFDVVCTRCIITSRFKQIVIFHECIVTKSSLKKNGGKNKMPQAPASLMGMSHRAFVEARFYKGGGAAQLLMRFNAKSITELMCHTTAPPRHALLSSTHGHLAEASTGEANSTCPHGTSRQEKNSHQV